MDSAEKAPNAKKIKRENENDGKKDEATAVLRKLSEFFSAVPPKTEKKQIAGCESLKKFVKSGLVSEHGLFAECFDAAEKCYFMCTVNAVLAEKGFNKPNETLVGKWFSVLETINECGIVEGFNEEEKGMCDDWAFYEHFHKEITACEDGFGFGNILESLQKEMRKFVDPMKEICQKFARDEITKEEKDLFLEKVKPSSSKRVYLVNCISDISSLTKTPVKCLFARGPFLVFLSKFVLDEAKLLWDQNELTVLELEKFAVMKWKNTAGGPEDRNNYEEDKKKWEQSDVPTSKKAGKTYL